MHIFTLMTVKALVQSFVKDLVEESAASLPSGTVGHQSKRPLLYPRPNDKDQQSGNQISRVLFWSHIFIIFVWGCNSVLGVECEDNPVTYSICVYA